MAWIRDRPWPPLPTPGTGPGTALQPAQPLPNQQQAQQGQPDRAPDTRKTATMEQNVGLFGSTERPAAGVSATTIVRQFGKNPLRADLATRAATIRIAGVTL